MDFIYTATPDDKPKSDATLQSTDHRKVVHCMCENCEDGAPHCIDFDWDAPDEGSTTSDAEEVSMVLNPNKVFATAQSSGSRDTIDPLSVEKILRAPHQPLDVALRGLVEGAVASIDCPEVSRIARMEKR